MSILASCHLPDGSWTFDVQPESPSPDIEVGFTSDVTPVKFDGLTFGFTVSVDDTLKLTASYPPDGVRYVATDQQYISSDRVDLAADDEATVIVWMVNAGERHEASTTFTVPRPEQPFPSWTWEGEVWQPPTPKPEGKNYEWVEDEREWVYTGPPAPTIVEL